MKLNELSNPDVIDKTKSLNKDDTKQPDMYEVWLHNDDSVYGPFVVEMLHKYFNKNPTEAFNIMREAHQLNHAVVGVFPKDVAESKVQKASAEEPPVGNKLTLTVEKA